MRCSPVNHSLPFVFHALLMELWEIVLQRVLRNIKKWIMKLMFVASKFQICSKFYPCILVLKLGPLVETYFWLEEFLWKLMGTNSNKDKGFLKWIGTYIAHRKIFKENWEFLRLEHKLMLCTKWIIRVVEGHEAWKSLLRNSIRLGAPCDCKAWVI